MSKAWQARDAEPDLPDTLVLFDGVCALCSFWVRFVIARDPEGRFRFLSIQDERGRLLARRLGIDPDDPETNAVLVGGRALFKSDAVLAVLVRLPGWEWCRRLAALPKPLRDWLYDRVARNRYDLFGRRQACMVPTADAARRLGIDPADRT